MVVDHRCVDIAAIVIDDDAAVVGIADRGVDHRRTQRAAGIGQDIPQNRVFVDAERDVATQRTGAQGEFGIGKDQPLDVEQCVETSDAVSRRDKHLAETRADEIVATRARK